MYEHMDLTFGEFVSKPIFSLTKYMIFFYVSGMNLKREGKGADVGCLAGTVAGLVLLGLRG